MPTPKEKSILLKSALQRGTVCVSVAAWYQRPDGIYYKPQGATDNHWVQLVKYENDCPVVFDSYDAYLKTLDPLYDFGIAKLYNLSPAQPKISLLSKILDLIGKILAIDALIIKQRQTPLVIPTPPPPPAPPPQPSRVSKIPIWAAAITIEEGWQPNISRSARNHNPGNLKASNYTMSLGAVGKDADNFCIFPTDNIGNLALHQFLTDAANNRLKPYHDKTLYDFTAIYANPPSSAYALSVARALNCDVNILIKELL